MNRTSEMFCVFPRYGTFEIFLAMYVSYDVPQVVKHSFLLIIVCHRKILKTAKSDRELVLHDLIKCYQLLVLTKVIPKE